MIQIGKNFNEVIEWVGKNNAYLTPASKYSFFQFIQWTVQNNEMPTDENLDEWLGGFWYFSNGLGPQTQEAKDSLEAIEEIGFDWAYYLDKEKTLLVFGLATSNAGGASFFVSHLSPDWEKWKEELKEHLEDEEYIQNMIQSISSVSILNVNH